MKIFKRFLPLCLFAVVLIVGLILFLKDKDLNLFTQHGFFVLSLLVIGGVGTIASLFITLFSKPIDSYKNNDYSPMANTIKIELSKIEKENADDTKENETQTAQEVKHKKVRCSYCKCKFDSSLSRCPNCGAPPESED